MLEKPWKDLTFVAFDTETSGQYPLVAEICELSAVKWTKGQIVDEFTSLIQTRRPIPKNVIEIHGITNEMITGAPRIEEKLAEFLEFIDGAVLVAHHAAFDLGFIAHDLESHDYDLPDNSVVCTSLLSRRVIPESKNHRLQTLIPHLGIEGGTAHRALDDAKACLEVGLECFRRVGEDATLEEILKQQGDQLSWSRFSMRDLQKDRNLKALIEGTLQEEAIEIKYQGGSRSGQAREVTPMGVVRSLDGDYFVGFCHIDQKKKRFLLSKIASARIIH